jgi:hypothetical protein
LVLQNGRWDWVDWALAALPQQGGYGMRAACDLGDHWLAEEGEALVWGFEPYAWTSAVAAFAAAERFEQQFKQNRP